MAFKIDISKTTKVAEGSGGPFKPLKAGPYIATVHDAEIGEFKGEKPQRPNAGRPQVNVQFRIADGQEGANRRVFQQIGLFDTWAPTDKNPEGSDNFTFFGFFSAIQGKKEKDFRAEYREAVENPETSDFSVPSPTELLGRKVVLNLKVVPDTYAYTKAVNEGTLEEGQTQQDYLKNEIGGFKVYDGSDPVAGGAQTSAAKVEAVEL